MPSASIEPTHPDAYRPQRKLLPERPASLLPTAIFIAVFAVFLQDWASVGTLIGLGVAVVLVGGLLVRRRRAHCPVVVDESGLIFGDTGDGARLVPWTSITSVVLFEIPRTDTAKNLWQDAIGARLTDHPDVIAVQRSLSGWTVNRTELRAAVARFGGGIDVVQGERAGTERAGSRFQTEATGAAEADPAGNSTSAWPQPGLAAVPGQQPKISWYRTARYQPIDPTAYLARLDLRSNLPLIGVLVVVQVFVWAFMVPQSPGAGILFAAAFAVPLVFIGNSLRSGGAVALAVDRPGVFFGESSSPGDDQDHRLLPWADITAVVVYEQLVHDSDSNDTWHRAVGVRRRSTPHLVPDWRIITGWRFDRPALEAAVARFAPGVPVIDGPPQRSPRAGHRRQALFEANLNRQQRED